MGAMGAECAEEPNGAEGAEGAEGAKGAEQRALILATCLNDLLKAHSPSIKRARKPLRSATECFSQLLSFRLKKACNYGKRI